MATSILRYNARVNAWSTFFMNLATALTAGIVYRLFIEGRADLTVGAWIFVLLALILAGHGLLSLLQSEVEA